MTSDLPYVDTHRLRVAAPREEVWRAARAWVTTSLTSEGGSLFTRLLGTVPASGFAVTEEVPGERIELAGRHRFSRYRLVFETGDLPEGGTVLAAVTYAAFPGPHGRVYRVLVIDSRAHVVATRLMLRAIRRRIGER